MVPPILSSVRRGSARNKRGIPARAHVFGAGRIPADDTTVKVLAKLKTVTGRKWTYVRDDRPFATVVRTTFDDNGVSTVKSRLLWSPSPRFSPACQRL
jgi:hypothetical protein